MKSGIRKWVAILIGIAILGAACGDDDGDSKRAGSVAPSGSPIKVGITGPYTSPAVTFVESRHAAEAAVKAINEEGGVKGRPLELVACDMKLDPNEAQACARRLADDKEIVAVLGEVITFGNPALSIWESAGLADIAPYPSGQDQYTNPISFPIAGGGAVLFVGMGVMAVGQKMTKVSIVHTDVSVVQALLTPLQGLLQKAGVKVLNMVPVSEQSADVSSAAAKAAQGSPDAILLVMGNPNLAKVLQALAQAKVNAKRIAAGADLDAATLAQLGPAAEGTLAVNSFPPVTSSHPAVSPFNADLDKFAPKDVKRTDIALNAWAAVQLFARVAGTLQSIDRPSVLAAMNGLSSVDTGGLTPALDFSKPSPAPGTPRLFNPFLYFQMVKDGKLANIDEQPHNVFAG